ncbi:hypothetical protein H0H87_010844 [Tephrocybe sp. NHM501043]|nr:hypothetical protein H0H87_010844 [Tephrocybe sp. NHM501043]
MRFTIAPTLLVSSLLLFGLGQASILAGHQLQQATPTENPTRGFEVLAARQHRIKRAVTSTCISVDGGVIAKAAGIIFPIFSNVHVCVCLNDLDLFLDTNANIRLLINLVGRSVVQRVINLLISTKGAVR